jgi:uncharacterized membrane protein HdeD (DUF308 family)
MCDPKTSVIINSVILIILGVLGFVPNVYSGGFGASWVGVIAIVAGIIGIIGALMPNKGLLYGSAILCFIGFILYTIALISYLLSGATITAGALIFLILTMLLFGSAAYGAYGYGSTVA